MRILIKNCAVLPMTCPKNYIAEGYIRIEQI